MCLLQGGYVPGQWGYCSASCPLHHDSSLECLTVAGPDTAEVCVFPFMAGGALHWGCTGGGGKRVNSGRPEVEG